MLCNFNVSIHYNITVYKNWKKSCKHWVDLLVLPALMEMEIFQITLGPDFKTGMICKPTGIHWKYYGRNNCIRMIYKSELSLMNTTQEYYIYIFELHIVSKIWKIVSKSSNVYKLPPRTSFSVSQRVVEIDD